MKQPFRVWKDVYVVGSPEVTSPSDCCVYMIDGGELVLIDSGAGASFNQLIDNIKLLGLDPQRLTTLIVSHAHNDHIGAVAEFQQRYGIRVVAHELEAPAIETGYGTGGQFHGVRYQPCQVSMQVSKPEEILTVGRYELHLIHIPGHTQGSIAVYLDMGKRVLLGQDIPGPHLPAWGADLAQACASLQKLVDVGADILCAGPFGIYQPAGEVRRYLQGYLLQLERLIEQNSRVI